ncbi:hypothetical protein F4818DRAFT_437832 [Hypoxylon cercidicola]|nr:hypothetical protein F4818DRAFT_437832 [Hypoxylon cercidicola]
MPTPPMPTLDLLRSNKMLLFRSPFPTLYGWDTIVAGTLLAFRICERSGQQTCPAPYTKAMCVWACYHFKYPRYDHMAKSSKNSKYHERQLAGPCGWRGCNFASAQQDAVKPEKSMTHIGEEHIAAEKGEDGKFPCQWMDGQGNFPCQWIDWHGNFLCQWIDQHGNFLC